MGARRGVWPWCGGVRGGPMEYPDHLKTRVPIGGAGSADLGDWLADELRWDAANWDPGAEPPVPATPGPEPAGTAARLRHGGPEPVYRALVRLTRLGALPSMRWPRAWPAAASPGPAGPGPASSGAAGPGANCPGNPWPPGGPAAGPATARAVGVQEALKTPGVRLICITGPGRGRQDPPGHRHRDRKPGEIGCRRPSGGPCRAVADRCAAFHGVAGGAAPAGPDGS